MRRDRRFAEGPLNVDDAPWWLIALSFIGVQLVVWPFFVFIASVGGDAWLSPPGSWAFGAVMLAVGWALLRPQPGMFVSQLGLGALLAGMGLLIASSVQSLDPFDGAYSVAMLVGAVIAMALALGLRIGWMQRLFGFVATLLLMGIQFEYADGLRMLRGYPQPLNIVVLTLAWAAWKLWGRSQALSSRASAMADGAVVAVLLAVLVSQPTHALRGAVSGVGPTGSADAPQAGMVALWTLNGWTLLQLALAAVAVALWWLRSRQSAPATPRRTHGLMGVVYGLLAVIAPMLGAAGTLAMVGTVALLTGQRRVLALAGLALLADFSGFYYALQWPLVHKALLLAGMGAVLVAVLATLAWRDRRGVWPAAITAPDANASPWTAVALLVGLVLILGAVHADVRRKEQVIAGGQKIYIPLAPRDPRSLMQGDYMSLNFALPPAVRADNSEVAAGHWWPRNTQWVVARVATNGVATIQRLDQPGVPLAADEIRVPLKHLKGEWMVVTDAFFFPEGQGEPFKAARFGEFRALADARMLLVGMADKDLRPITPAPRSSSNQEAVDSAAAGAPGSDAVPPGDTLVTLPDDDPKPAVSPSQPEAPPVPHRPKGRS